MALVSGGRSTLNPDAPLFIPAAFLQVEDFSPEWWQLVTTSTWYHDYWLSQHQDVYENPENEVDNIADLLPETFDIEADDDFSSMEAQFEEFIRFSQTEGLDMHAEGGMKNMNLMNTLEGRAPRSLIQPAKYAQKPTKRVSPKYNPRCIQQPR